MKWDYDALNKWRKETHIPMSVKRMVNAVMKELNMYPVFTYSDNNDNNDDDEDDDGGEEVIKLYNRGGYTYGRAKGFTLSYCTSSYANGPDDDPRYLIDFIKSLGFRIENSYGDNGMDSATNFRDTYWSYEFIFEPSIAYDEEFTIWEESDYEE